MEPHHQTCTVLGQGGQDRDGQREEGHCERTQYSLTYIWAYTKYEDLVCPSLNSNHVRPC